MKRVVSVIATAAMLFSFAAMPAPVRAPNDVLTYSESTTPPNEGGIAKALMDQGVLAKDATQQEIDKAVTEYIQQKLDGTPNNPTADKTLLLQDIKKNGQQGLSYENLISGKKLGKDITSMGEVTEQPWNGQVNSAKMLILLAEFSDDEYGSGPVHNQIAKPSPADNTTLWVKDFSTDHYNKMLFTQGGYDATDKDDKTLHLNSLVDYYLEQSGGSYQVDGQAYGWFKVPHSEAYYGDDNPNGGHDNLQPGVNKDLVKDVLKEAQKAGVNFSDYDLEDPYDLDSDGDYYEPDGIVDRLVIVHAGVDQSGGGGAQGVNALWAHSSSVGLWKIPGTNMMAYRYIMQGENGAIGVFAHEFGHNLGLPDEYDTIYSGNDESINFHSLMSSGSWTGNPLGSEPTPLSPYAKMQLQGIYGGNWAKVTEVNSQDITTAGMSFKLDQSTSKGQNSEIVKVNLPPQQVSSILPHEGSYEFFGGQANNSNSTLQTKLSLPAASQVSLNYWTWCNAEKDYDYGYVEVSQDGTNWDNLKTYTGSTNGWVQEALDLTAYAGKNIFLRFRYSTDSNTLEEGFFVDQVSVAADNSSVFQDNAETGDGNWSMNGWSRYNGFEQKDHYYLLEWRNAAKTDEGRNYAYNWVDYDNQIAEYFPLEPGLLVWYRNTAYTDNWVGRHPGYAYLGIVDAHPTPIVADGLDVRSRLQTRDAAFNLERATDSTFTFNGQAKVYQGKQAVPEFNDSHSYWNPKAPSAGLKVPTYGLKFKVVGHSPDNSVGEVALYK